MIRSSPNPTLAATSANVVPNTTNNNNNRRRRRRRYINSQSQQQQTVHDSESQSPNGTSNFTTSSPLSPPSSFPSRPWYRRLILSILSSTFSSSSTTSSSSPTTNNNDNNSSKPTTDFTTNPITPPHHQTSFDYYNNNNDDLPLRRPDTTMKFLERGVGDQFTEHELTRKEVFDLVCQLATVNNNTNLRDRRQYRHHTNSHHHSLAARPTRSENVYNRTTPLSPSPPPTPTLSSSPRETNNNNNNNNTTFINTTTTTNLPSPTTATNATNIGTGFTSGTNSGGNRLTLRDLRQIDPKFSSNAAIWVREEAMLVNLENIRAIILSDRLFLFDPDNQAVRQSIWHIEKTLAQDVESNFGPFEFRALEGILIHTCLSLEFDLSSIEPKLVDVLKKLPFASSSQWLERLRHEEQGLKQYVARARKVHQAIQSLLDDDEDMSDMYLTEKRKMNISGGGGGGGHYHARNPLDHNDVEMLLETYLQMVDDISNRAQLLQRSIDDTENLVEMHLDTVQNRVLLLHLVITSITTACSFATLITSIFGMNVHFPFDINKGLNSRKFFFGTITFVAIVMSSVLAGIIIWCQRKGLFSGRLPSRPTMRKTIRFSFPHRSNNNNNNENMNPSSSSSFNISTTNIYTTSAATTSEKQHTTSNATAEPAAAFAPVLPGTTVTDATTMGTVTSTAMMTPSSLPLATTTTTTTTLNWLSKMWRKFGARKEKENKGILKHVGSGGGVQPQQSRNMTNDLTEFGLIEEAQEQDEGKEEKKKNRPKDGKQHVS